MGGHWSMHPTGMFHLPIIGVHQVCHSCGCRSGSGSNSSRFRVSASFFVFPFHGNLQLIDNSEELWTTSISFYQEFGSASRSVFTLWELTFFLVRPPIKSGQLKSSLRCLKTIVELLYVNETNTWKLLNFCDMWALEKPTATAVHRRENICTKYVYTCVVCTLP